jgi:hypothetical protein
MWYDDKLVIPFGIFFDIFLTKAVLLNIILGHLQSEIAGEQQMIFKIIGLP